MNDKKRKKKIIILIILVIIALLTTLVLLSYKNFFKKPVKPTIKKAEIKETTSAYKMSGNRLENFDLSFLKLENKAENMIYSPLSIKYTLKMLEEGTKGNSKAQIKNILGQYNPNKYNNNSNMSFANALFINKVDEDKIKETYISNLLTKYNAEVIFDSFETANNINSWVSNKTFGLINNLLDNISDNQYILVNALAIDMEWNNVLQADGTTNYRDYYSVSYPHENYSVYISPIDEDNYSSLKFNNSLNAKAVEIGASINNYDIIKELGEESIRENVGREYEKWLDKDLCGGRDENPNVDEYLDNYIKELSSSYKNVKSSTDFLFYDDDEMKVFSKELRQYNNTTLQYIAIMPKTIELTNYISKLEASKVSEIINKLKAINLNNFQYGKIYKITGQIPLFKFDYNLDLINDLNKLGIKDVFNKDKADLSNLSKSKNSYINKAFHKTNIEFSNHGIKAAATTTLGGLGSSSCSFDYLYDVPIETIDLTFDKPYLFLIRDKYTEEVWFTGKVYHPITH